MKPGKTMAYLVILMCLTGALSAGVPAQGGGNDPNVTFSPALLDGMSYRLLDFSRGGRVTAVAGVTGDPLTYYFGSTGGGVWKTRNAGLTWENVSDGFFEAGSIGAVTVAESDANVIYAGTGSACPRGNVSPGIGLYKSTDAGKSWKHSGLRDAGQIGRIAVNPRNSDLVYAAVLGHIFGRNAERGVFRSRDGGKSWEKVLFVSDRTGAVDLSMDPNNPRVIYAAMWTTERKPWTIDSGSEESGLFKTTDGGDTWKRLSGGLPSGIVGRIGVAVSPAAPDRVWALVEAPEDLGGVYRSDNGGSSWQKVTGERRFVQRAWYYIHIYADPKNPDSVYVLNTGFYKSNDGGRTFQSYRTPHGDNHDLWINPDDPNKMINGNDGGANVSLDGGMSWTDQMNQPTAEFYRIAVDNRFPYRMYGAQQDNSTASVSSRGEGFYDVGGGESGYIAVDPRNPDIVYAGSYGGTITRMDVGTGLIRSVMPYPESATGQRAADMKYRFQWNAPIRISPNDPSVLYTCSQYVHRSTDGGLSWEVISPDLTRNDKSKQDYSGQPITHDDTGVEVYDTIFAFEESPAVKGLLWSGSDDGVVQISRDNGRNWTNITPPAMPEFGTVNMIDLSAHDPGRAFIAVHRYRLDDFKPYIFRTNDYGATWDLLTGGNGIPADHFVRVVREDPDRKGLLYAGTEFGMYVSFDDGTHWQTLQLNLPATPISDLMVYHKDLLVATQGRSFWILDDLTALHQIDDTVAKASIHLFAPRPAYRAPGFSAGIDVYFAEPPKGPVALEILDARGNVLRSLPVRSGRGAGGGGEQAVAPTGRPGGGSGSTLRQGLNRLSWNLALDPLFTLPPRTVLWGGSGGTVKAVPGNYQVRLRAGDFSQTQPLQVLKDPRNPTTDAEYQEQFDLAQLVGGKVKVLYDNLLELRDVRRQVNDAAQRLEGGEYGREVRNAADSLDKKLTAIEGELTQLKGEGGQDALNFPGRLDNQWVKLFSEVAGPDGKPTAGCRQRYADLQPQLDRLLADLKQVFDVYVAAFNKLVKDTGAPAVLVGRPAAKK